MKGFYVVLYSLAVRMLTLSHPGIGDEYSA